VVITVEETWAANAAAAAVRSLLVTVSGLVDQAVTSAHTTHAHNVAAVHKQTMALRHTIETTLCNRACGNASDEQTDRREEGNKRICPNIIG
jgi:hypothetical protein